MKLRLLAAALAATTLVAGTAAAQDTSSEKGKLSYAIGYNTGAELAELTARGEAVDVNTVIKALQDAYGKKEPTVPVDQLRTAVENMQKRQQAKMEAEFRQLAAANKTASDTFLAQNKAKAGVQSLPGGVQYRVIETGNGAKPTQASDVQLTYKGSLPTAVRATPTSAAGPKPRPGRAEVAMAVEPAEALCICRRLSLGSGHSARRPTARTSAPAACQPCRRFRVKLVSSVPRARCPPCRGTRPRVAHLPTPRRAAPCRAFALDPERRAGDNRVRAVQSPASRLPSTTGLFDGCSASATRSRPCCRWTPLSGT